MIALIVLGASILGNAAAFLGIPKAIADWVSSLGLSPFMLIVALIVFYLILGCFLDGFSMIVMTLPIVMPIIKGAGYDPIWFGVFLVLVVEMAQITPPVGFNLFVIQGLTDEGLGYIAKVTLPYLLILIAFTIFVTLYPDVVLWLPRVLGGRTSAPLLRPEHAVAGIAEARARCSRGRSGCDRSAAVKTWTSGWARASAAIPSGAAEQQPAGCRGRRAPSARLTAATAELPVASIGSTTTVSRSPMSSGSLQIILDRRQRRRIAVEADMADARRRGRGRAARRGARCRRAGSARAPASCP